jgi:predicted dehydrogenase
MLRLGVIGCGRVTTMFHLRAVRDISEIEVAAVSDIDEKLMREAADRCGAKAYSDYHELLTDPEIDGVAINTPPRLHETMVLDALSNGKHVLCEKPLSETVEGCTRIGEAQDESGLAVLPAHNYAFTPCLTRLTHLVGSGKVGGVRKLSVAFMNNLKTYRPHTDFRTTSGDGVLMDVLPHILSVSKQLAGTAVDVKELRWWCDDYQVCDNMETTLITDRGVDLECSMSWTKLVPRFGVEVHGYDGRLEAELMMKPYQVSLENRGRKKVYRDRGLGWYLDLVRFKHPSFRNQYLHFHRLASGLEPPRITVEDEIHILGVVEKLSEMM